MAFVDELTKRLPAVLHASMTLLSVPYVLLAALFLMIGHVLAQRGFWATLNALLDTFNWSMTWGLLMVFIVVMTILGAGFFEPARMWASLALAGLISVSLGIILYYCQPVPILDKLFYLTPALLILLTSLGMALAFYRAPVFR